MDLMKKPRLLRAMRSSRLKILAGATSAIVTPIIAMIYLSIVPEQAPIEIFFIIMIISNVIWLIYFTQEHVMLKKMLAMLDGE